MQIKLTQGQYAIVDDADYEWLNKYKWYADKQRYNYYAVGCPDGVNAISMHRFIIGLGKKDRKRLVIDHKNQDTLDNRRSNLRIVSYSVNKLNSSEYVLGIF